MLLSEVKQSLASDVQVDAKGMQVSDEAGAHCILYVSFLLEESRRVVFELMHLAKIPPRDRPGCNI